MFPIPSTSSSHHYRLGRLAFITLLLLAILLRNPSATSVLSAPSDWLLTARERHTASLLLDSRVLIAGGLNDGNFLESAELYDPVTGGWEATGNLNSPRSNHTATLLPDGTVLVFGGVNSTGYLASAERYNPATGVWIVTGSLNTPRAAHTATLLPMARFLP